MLLAWNKENIPNKMHTYDLPYTRRALSIHFELLRTHEDRGHILYMYISFFFGRCWRFENINFSARCRTINSSTDWKWLAENINKCVERMAVRGGLSPPPGPMNQIHYCHSLDISNIPPKILLINWLFSWKMSPLVVPSNSVKFKSAFVHA